MRCLLTRAAHLSPPPATLGIETEFADNADECSSASRVIRLRITDAGPAIPEQLLPHVFEPFYTSPDGTVRSDPELSICHRVFRQHGGALRIEHSGDGASSITAAIPVKEARTELRPEEGPRPPASPALKSRKVLVVDDDELCLGLLAATLQSKGFSVDTARDGVIALARIEKGDYDVVVADIHMPRMDGCQLHREVKRRDPVLARKMLFVTGDDLDGDIGEFLRSSSIRCIMKPFDIEDLANAVRQL